MQLNITVIAVLQFCVTVKWQTEIKASCHSSTASVV
jgi:hypothetical protein